MFGISEPSKREKKELLDAEVGFLSSSSKTDSTVRQASSFYRPPRRSTLLQTSPRQMELTEKMHTTGVRTSYFGEWLSEADSPTGVRDYAVRESDIYYRPFEPLSDVSRRNIGTDQSDPIGPLTIMKRFIDRWLLGKKESGFTVIRARGIAKTAGERQKINSNRYSHGIKETKKDSTPGSRSTETMDSTETFGVDGNYSGWGRLNYNTAFYNTDTSAADSGKRFSCSALDPKPTRSPPLDRHNSDLDISGKEKTKPVDNRSISPTALSKPNGRKTHNMVSHYRTSI